MKHIRSQTGFTTIEVAVAIVLLGIIGTAGFFAYQNYSHHKASTVTKPSTTPITKISPSPTAMIVFGQTVPADCGNYIQQAFETRKTQCISNSSGEFQETFTMTQPVVRDAYALVEENCGSGSEVAYSKVNNQWQQIFSFQNLLQCSYLDSFKFPKELIPTCLTSDYLQIANTNP